VGISFTLPAIVSILILGFVGLEQSAAGQGTSFQQEQIDDIRDIISEMQTELDNLHVQWGNVTAKPPGFENDTDDGIIGIFQSSDSNEEEPCNITDVVTWTGIIWDCLPLLWENIQGKPEGFADNIDNDVLGNLTCTKDQIAKWDDALSQWVCAEDLSGNSLSTEFEVKLESGTVTEAFEELHHFKIIGLPLSMERYSIPVNFMMLQSEMETDNGDFDIRLQDVFRGGLFKHLTLRVSNGEKDFRLEHDSSGLHIDEIFIEKGTTEKLFFITGEVYPRNGQPTTGNFTNLKLKLSFMLPDGASIDPMLPPDLVLSNEVDESLCDHVGDGTTACTFKVSVFNDGEGEATGVSVFNSLSIEGESAGVIDSAITSDGEYEVEGNSLEWYIDSIPPGVTVTLTINAISSVVEPSFTNTASIESIGQEVEATKVFP
jgi:hypothetical protein